MSRRAVRFLYAGATLAIVMSILAVTDASAAPLPDAFEPNDSIAAATVLGSPPQVTLNDLTIHIGSDQDFLKITANDTGVLVVNVFFTNAAGNLNLEVQDARGNVLASSATTNDDEQVTIPVVAQQRYYVRVLGAGGATNTYDLEIENFAAPIPTSVTLETADDSGTDSGDNVTFRTAQVGYHVHADLADFANAGIAILTPAQAAGGVTPGAAVGVFDNGVPVGFASVKAGTNDTVFDVAFDADLVALPIGGPNAAGPKGYQGFLNVVTAAVVIVDGQEDAGGNPDPATGRTPLSPGLDTIADNTAPVAPSPPDLENSSDSGASNTDNVTNINALALQGVAEANALLNMRANGIGVGQATVGTDASDGVLGNGLGVWEITAAPLADGTYSMTASAEDAAGNIGSSSAALSVTIDTRDGVGQPQRPTLDLLDASDSGPSSTDNVTNRSAVDVRVSAEADSTVVIKNGQTVVDTFTMPGTGFTTRTLLKGPALPADDLLEGPNPLSAEATDLAGNASPQSEQLLVTIDTTFPAAPTVPDLLPFSDTGASNNDNVTAITSPAFLGVAEANAIIIVRANGVAVGQGVVGTDASDGVLGNGLGVWEISTAPLADGVYGMTAAAEDTAGNIGLPSATLSVTIDTRDGGGQPQRPTLDLLDASDSGLSSTDNVTNRSAVDVRVSAEAGSTVVIKNGQTVVDTFAMPGTGFTTRTLVKGSALPAADLLEGPNPLSAEATDVAGNASPQSEQLLVTIDTTPPSAPTVPDLLPSSDTGVSNDNITAITSPAFHGVAEANTIVIVDANGFTVGQGVVGADGTDGMLDNGLGRWEVTVKPLSFGTYGITARVEDAAGNISPASAALSVQVVPEFGSGFGGPFTSATDYLVGKRPQGVAVGDVDGDGNLDLVVANSGSSTISVRLGTSSGTFGEQVTFPAGGKKPTSVALGDLDGDDNPDIVVANSGSNNVAVLLGNGDGTFGAATTFKTGKFPLSVEVGLIDGNTSLDVVTANSGSGDVSVLLGNGNGTLGAATNVKTNGKGPQDLAIGDFDDDGNADVVTANLKKNNVSFLAGDGSGGFAAPALFAVGSQPTSIVAADFNGDGNLDIAVSNQKSNNVSVLLGNGSAGGSQFQEQQRIHYPGNKTAVSITAGDVNLDGHMDLAIANQKTNTFSLLLGAGNGTFSDPVDFSVGNVRKGQPVSIAVGDLNGDGFLDVVVVSAGTNEVSVLLGNTIP